jgi:hypothetical protein
MGGFLTPRISHTPKPLVQTSFLGGVLSFEIPPPKIKVPRGPVTTLLPPLSRFLPMAEQNQRNGDLPRTRQRELSTRPPFLPARMAACPTHPASTVTTLMAASDHLCSLGKLRCLESIESWLFCARANQSHDDKNAKTNAMALSFAVIKVFPSNLECGPAFRQTKRPRNAHETRARSAACTHHTRSTA